MQEDNLFMDRNESDVPADKLSTGLNPPTWSQEVANAKLLYMDGSQSVKFRPSCIQLELPPGHWTDMILCARWMMLI